MFSDLKGKVAVVTGAGKRTGIGFGVARELAACGCRLVASRLEGVESELAPRLGGALEMVDLPPMAGVDTPDPAGLPAFVDRLIAALGRALDRGPVGESPAGLERFTWHAVFRRVEAVWRLAMGWG